MIYGFRGRALVADEQGLGKTIQALSWIQRLPKRRPVLIVTPSSIKYAWQNEAHIHFGMKTIVLEGQGPKRSGNFMAEEDGIFIINYDILPHWLPALRRNPPQIVVFDEGHYIKNRGALRTKASRRIAETAASVVVLSGTPMTNKPVELWSILNIIRPELFPDFSAYAWRYCQPKWTRWGWTFPGARRKSELWTTLKETCMIRRLKRDVAPELPKKIQKTIPVRLDSYREYEKAESRFMAWLRERSPARAQRAKRAQALVKVGYLLRLCAELRLRWTVDFIRDFARDNPGAKLVGMTGHRFVIDHLRKEFPNSVVIDGRVTGRLRSESVKRFTNDRSVRWLWGNWRAAGVGLNLQVANTLISLDPPWTPGDLLQGQDRIHRIGQNRRVFIYHPFAMRTIEEKWVNLLRDRTRILRTILDGDADPDGSGSIENLLESITGHS